ncbi:hypothetical protein [Novosphingopyxis sp.]|uniref:hypothetical protein n=1 Tax=Novosphingopyxis sp. TaxID=2709690 RepID=UPI003B5C6AEA
MGLLPLALIVLPLAPAAAQRTTDPSGGFRLDPVPTPAPTPGPVIAPLPTPAPVPSPTPRSLPTGTQVPVAVPTLARPRPSPAPTPRPAPTPASAPRPTSAAPPVPATQTVPQSDAILAAPEATPTVEASTPSIEAPDIPATAAPAAISSEEPEDGALWPWIAALLLLALGGAFWWRRRKRMQSLRDESLVYEEPAQVDEAVEADEPTAATAVLPVPQPERAMEPAPSTDTPADDPALPAAPASKKPVPKGVVTSDAAPAAGTVRAFSGLTGTPPRAAPVQPRGSPVPSGLVTTRMAPPPAAGRPQMAMQLDILGAEQTATHFILQYRLWMINQGPGPADAAVLRLDVLPGGPDTQKQVDRFFQREQARGRTVTIPAMGPSSRTPVEGDMRVPLDPAITFRMEGRQMIIPLVAADLDYRWGGGQDRSQATFVLGRVGAAGQERLGPINIDLGPRIVRGIGAKPV